MDGITVAARKLVAQTMNMTKTNKERAYQIAVISGAARNSAGAGPMATQSAYTIDWDGSRALISAVGWDDTNWSERLSMVQGVLALFNCIPIGPEVQIDWMFSGKTLKQPESIDVMDRWLDEHAPPVMDLIDFVAEEDGVGRWVRTYGLFPIVGHEIEVFIDRTSSKELPRVVGYLAQETLRSGPVRTREILGPDGTAYRLDHIAKSLKYPPIIRVSLSNPSEMDLVTRA
jgi:hypothetical protein